MEYTTQNSFGNTQNNQFETPPNNNLVFAIISLFCCLPTGIYAIVKASEVNSKWNAGDKVGALASADQAKKWALYGTIAGIVVNVIYFGFLGGLAMLGMGANAAQ